MPANPPQLLQRLLADWQRAGVAAELRSRDLALHGVERRALAMQGRMQGACIADIRGIDRNKA